MPWNEPGGGKKDPWGSGGGGGDNGLDLDAIFKRARQRMGRFGGGGGGIAMLVLALLLAWLLLDSWVVIDARQVGVVLRFGQYSRSLPPGFHAKLPRPLESVTKVETTKVRSVSDSATMLTNDENIISVNFNVQYQVADARKYLFDISDPDETLRQGAEAAVRAVIGGSKMDKILSGQGAQLVSDTRTVLQHTLDSYNSGLVVSDVSFQNVAPPDQVKEAFDDVNKAREDKQRIENEAQAYSSKVVPEARGAAARIKAQARGDKAERIARANGDAKRFDLLLEQYHAAPEVTRRRLWLETMQQIMADNRKVIDGGERNLIYLPMGTGGGSSSPNTPLPGVGAVMHAAPDDNSAGSSSSDGGTQGGAS